MKLVSGKGQNVASRSNGARKSAAVQNQSVAQKPSAAKKPNTTQGAAAVQKTPQRKKKKRTGLKVAVILLLVLALAAVGAVAALGFYVDNLETVFPNVWADGIELSGLTLSEANRTLINAGYENNADNISATVNFSDGTSFTIFGNEIGLSLNAEEAALAAFYIGRNGSFIDNIRTYIHSRSNITDLRNVSVGSMDVDFIRNVVSEYTLKFNNTLLDGAVTITDTSITLELGTGVDAADEQYVFDLTINTIYAAMDEQAHLSVYVVTGESEKVEVDLEMLFSRIHVDPVDSTLDRTDFTVTASSQGITFDIAAAQAALDRAQTGDQVVIPLVVLQPEVVEEEIYALLFRDVLGERTTSAATSAAGRLNNIRVSAEFINGTVFLPGEVFSFNGVVGPRTEARGFQMGGAFIGGRLENAIGGGICQTSSTLYNAVLYAGLEVVHRRPHTFIVTYLPFGLDAMVAWGQNDFKFRNSTDYPIRIEAGMEGTSVYMRIIGTETRDYTIRLRSVTINTRAIQTIEIVDEELTPGTTRQAQGGSVGVTADVYIARIDADGNVIDERLLGREVYGMMHRIVYVNPIPEDEYPEDPYQPPGEEPPGQPPGTGDPPGYPPYVPDPPYPPYVPEPPDDPPYIPQPPPGETGYPSDDD